jgi:hypothetical protein
MSLNKRKFLLNKRLRRETEVIHKKYRKLIKALEARCIEHHFSNWGSRPDELQGGLQSNFLGKPFKFRHCYLCGKTEQSVWEL